MATKTQEANKILPVTKSMKDLVDTIGFNVAHLRELEQQVNEDKGDLRFNAKPAYFKMNLRKGDETQVHTVDIVGRNHVAQLNFMNDYHLNADRLERLQDILGTQITRDYFSVEPSVRVNLASVAKSKQTAFLQELNELCNEYRAEAVVVDEHKVSPTFHTDRHQLSINENLEIDAVLPMEVQVTF